MPTDQKKRKAYSETMNDQHKERNDWEKELDDTKKKLLNAEERAKEAEDRARVAEERAMTAEALIETLKAQKGPADSKNEEDEALSDDESVNTNDPWMMAFQELRAYRIIHGNCNATRNGPNPKVGYWVKNQKFLHGKGKLTKERVMMLESIRFQWKKSSEPPSWESKYEELAQYHKHMGHCNIPVNPKAPSDMAKWVTAQRVEYKHFVKGRGSLLTSEQIGQLKKLGFKWKGPKLG